MRDQLTGLLGDDLLDYQRDLLAMAERVDFNVKTMPQKRPESRHVERRLRGLEIGQIIIDDVVIGGHRDNAGHDLA